MGKNLKKQKQFRFSDSELALLERLKERHGSYTSAVIRGLELLDKRGQTDLTQAEVIDWIKRHT